MESPEQLHKEVVNGKNKETFAMASGFFRRIAD